MQTIDVAAIGNYYLGTQTADYYLNSEVTGRVIGSAAPILGIPERITRDGFVNLLAGRSPDGKRNLVRNSSAVCNVLVRQRW